MVNEGENFNGESIEYRVADGLERDVRRINH